MTDKELLEYAAKAAGPDIQWDSVESCWYMETAGDYGNPRWNPLTDDGDALRLAVKLEIDLIVGTGSKFVTARHEVTQLNEYEYKQDAYAATRRAIVRAAAEIGKAMK